MPSSDRPAAAPALQIDWLPVPGTRGQLGMTVCPGRRWAGAADPDWLRDLDADLRTIQDSGAGLLVTLMEAYELHEYGAGGLPLAVQSSPLDWLHLPIEDMCVPGPGFEQAWAFAGRMLRERLTGGERIVMHCLAGLGRTGTVAARLLVEFGTPPPDAVQRVRAARPGAIQSRVQLDYVLRLPF
ncbi:MAG: cyclin-dependent kinase inhibitor 3 family protein [Gammaproteobacteria bacterium]